MGDLKERLSSLDLVDPPELWSRVGSTAVLMPPNPRWRRVAATVMLIVALAIAVLVRLSYRDSAEPIRPGPKPNGPIYFVGSATGIQGQDTAVYVVNEDGTGFRQVLPSAAVPSINEFSVSRDGTWITYSTGGFDTVGDILALKTDGTEARRVTNDPAGVGHRPGGHADYSPDWSPDRHRITFMSSRCCDSPSGFSTFALYTIRPDGTGLKELTGGAPNVSNPVWSPDGTRIAFSGRREAIWIADVDRGDSHSLVSTGSFVKDLAWSPDGSRLAYLTSDPEGPTSAPWGSVPERFDVHIVNTDGTGHRVIYSCHDLCRFGGYAIEWSPDGEDIAFTFGRVRRFGIVWHVALVGVDGQGFRVLDTHGVQPRDISWIPKR